LVNDLILVADVQIFVSRNSDTSQAGFDRKAFTTSAGNSQ
jgi:hypothetical protein